VHYLIFFFEFEPLFKPLDEGLLGDGLRLFTAKAAAEAVVEATTHPE